MAEAWLIEAESQDKLVLLALADWSNDDGHCWPSIKQLCRKSSMSERSVQRSIARLVELGHLTRKENTGKGVFYTLHPRTDDTPVKLTPPSKSTQTPVNLTPNTPVTIIKSNRATPYHSIARETAQRSCAIPDWVPADAWAGFLAMRKAIKKPLTPRAVGLIIAKLERLQAAGNDPGAVLDQSTAACWQGVFELKGKSDERMAGNDRTATGNSVSIGIARAIARAGAEVAASRLAGAYDDDCSPEGALPGFTH